MPGPLLGRAPCGSILVMNTSRKRPLSLCILGGRSRSRAKVQVTGKDRSHTKTIGHWTKLFFIGILLYKIKQAKEPQFFLFWTLPNSTHEKIYSCWSCKEDLRYSITKFGNEITKVCKITWFVEKKRISKQRVIALRISWRVFGCFEQLMGKQRKNFRTV